MRVLLLEPNHLLAKNLAYGLKQAGHSVRHAVEPQAAVEIIDKQLPDALIMELMLASHSGAEFLYELRSYPEWAALPIIIYSHLPAADTKPYQASLDALNVTNIFYKPETSLSQLASALSQLVPANEAH